MPTKLQKNIIQKSHLVIALNNTITDTKITVRANRIIYLQLQAGIYLLNSLHDNNFALLCSSTFSI